MAVSVPEDVPPALNTIASLSDQDFDAAIAALDQQAESISTSAQAVDQDVVRLLASTATSLEVGRDTLGLSQRKFISEVLSSLTSANQLTLGALSREEFSARLAKLLSGSFIQNGAKATSLWLENERYAAGSRIVTDIRPIFGEEVEGAAPAAAIIIHTLKIEYVEAGERKSFFVRVDESDIESLVFDCERALGKRIALEKLLVSVKVALIRPFSGPDTDDGDDDETSAVAATLS